jgi:glycosyltransferase involved in cell wall biosynthesis
MRLLVASFIQPSESTGMGKWTARIAKELQRRGHEVSLFFAPSGGGAASRHLFGARVALELATRRNRLDVAVIHEPHAAEASILQHAGFPRVVVMSHGVESRVEEVLAQAARSGATDSPRLRRWRHAVLWGWRERVAFKNAAGTLCLSEADRYFLLHRLRIPADRVVRFVNGADLAPFVAKPEGGELVLSIGTWIPEKGSRLLPRIWRRVRERWAWGKLVLAGTGLEGRSVLRDFSDVDHDSVMVIPRFGAPQDIQGFVKKAGVFILPSLREGSPLALLEAMSYGLPPVAAAVGGVPEIISRQEEGMLYPPEDVELAAEHVLGLLGDASRRATVGKAARERVQYLTWAAAADAVERACEAALRDP